MKFGAVQNSFLILLLSGSLSAQTHDGHGIPPSKKNTSQEETRVEIKVPLNQQERIGLQTTKVTRKPVNHVIRTVGIVTTDQGTEDRIHLRVNGWIEEIFADYVGKLVKKGDPLFAIYSPEVLSTEEEYVEAIKQKTAGKEIADVAIERLKLWGVSSKELKRLQTSLKASRIVAFASPANGYVLSKNAIKGLYVTPDLELYHIGDLTRIWINVTLYEFDIASVSQGDTAKIELPYDPQWQLKGKIDYIFPQIESQSRSAKARIQVENRDLKLKPGMYVNIIVEKNLGQLLVVPDDAVIDTGMRQIVFVKKTNTQFEPREIKMGPRVGSDYTVFSGLKDGEEVVSSAQFLIDAESKLQAAINKQPFQHSGHK